MRPRGVWWLGLLGIALLGMPLAGCGSAAVDRPPEPRPPQTVAPDTLPTGATLRAVDHLGARYTVATLDLHEVALDLYGQTPEHGAVQTILGLEAWLTAQGRRLVLATNSGIYETDGRPVGLHVERGRELSPLNLSDAPGNFFLKPNAVFYVDGEPGGEAAHVVESGAYDRPSAEVRLATQSGPALLLGGELHPRFLPDATSLKLRSGVGVDARQPHVVHLAISE